MRNSHIGKNEQVFIFKVGVMLEIPYIFDIVDYRPYNHVTPEQETCATIKMFGISSGANPIDFFGYCRLLEQVPKCYTNLITSVFRKKRLSTPTLLSS